MTPASLLLPVSFLVMFGAGLGLHLMTQRRALTARRTERFRAALDRHERISFIDLLAPADFAKPAPYVRKPLACRVFGYNPDRLDIYRWPPAVVAAIGLCLSAIGGCVATLAVGRAGLLATLPLWPYATRMLFRRWETKRAAVLFQQFPDALAMVVRGVRVGIPVAEAIGAVSRDGPVPTAPEFGRVVEQVAIGLPLDEALHVMAARTGLPEYRFFATALALQGQTGGNLSETLEGLADTIRKRVAARARGFALAAEARTSANVLTALPMLLFVVLWFMNPHYVMALLEDGTGHMILGATAGLLGFGVLAMRTLIRKSLS